MSEPKNDNIKLIENVFTLLELLFIHEKMGIREIANVSGLAKSSVFRIIKTLVALKVVEQDSDELYRLGLTLSKYGNKINHSMDIVLSAKPVMKALAKETGESINLGILHEQQVLVLHTEMGEAYTLQPMLLPISPLYCSAMGKIFLSQMPPPEREGYFSQPLLQRTVNTITDLVTFTPEMQTIRQNHVAFDHEEYEYGLTCMAVPIYDRKKHVIAAISLSGPTTRLSFKGWQHLEQALKKHAQEMKLD